ncbi:hypothetical protein PLEOSDRAFT_1109816 [Pleurotus ostreatus PC15]|uniref:Uncharacterized protein n=2 Tax=Pleurotus TaxID=5320 RepID=A0A067N6Y2_PLEO1|nr:hypothetical protein CCMSSC00406_0003044 [Pleurotus cornucopiae]KDQ22720.1 hypothetical protein PLEOSDRAFT_1109816 [Pleurotus ostreatus PC15]
MSFHDDERISALESLLNTTSRMARKAQVLADVVAAEMKFTRKTQRDALARISAVEQTVKLPNRRVPFLPRSSLSSNVSHQPPPKLKSHIATPIPRRVPSFTSCPPSPSISSLDFEEFDSLLANDDVEQRLPLKDPVAVEKIQPIDSLLANDDVERLDAVLAIPPPVIPPNGSPPAVGRTPHIMFLLRKSFLVFPRFALPPLWTVLLMALLGYFILGVLYLDIVGLDDLHYDILEGFRQRVPQ